MILDIVKPGPLATLQAGARAGLRHQGIPASGPADPLSMALANRLAGNAPDVPAIEITFGGAEFRFLADTAFALAGAAPRGDLSGQIVRPHETLSARAGDILHIPHPPAGVRTYLAIPGGFHADVAFGSASTFIPAGFGGHSGRALRAGDVLAAAGNPSQAIPQLATPPALRPHMSHAHTLRAVPGPDYEMAAAAAWSETFRASNRMDRTGLELAGAWPASVAGALRPSAALFAGAVQLTPSGNAFVLLPDAQTTGGYPHVLQVIRADRHLLGQVAPGDRVQFLKRSVNEASDDLRSKAEYFADWLPGGVFGGQ
ncbi:biotin-dependent carboxyltransferase family protein [Hyphomonas sp. WL0036]|uniref:5-oxoprolinase subunit C family protein n=1 Tax=Hyphomonas sediminis TaxID=2866160 RepID=UPI001C82614E|nr:biotin-dependent carboxyltransferase family protein [Hyphomonas sediminis]MBY9067184.1 biotin-dependent carboxyltransferase family protein [Hyphomonas sediminis]